jgi:hypothetical protein
MSALPASLEYEVSANGIYGRPPPVDEKQVALCREWLRAFIRPRTRFNAEYSSYVLKHRVQAWADEYVSNGAFIVAAMREGYRVQPRGKLNANFNMSFPRSTACRQCGVFTRWNRKHHCYAAPKGDVRRCAKRKVDRCRARRAA